jgi:hypothetical protein
MAQLLSRDQELAVWRKQASISVQEEFAGKALPATLEDSLSPNLQELFDRVRTGVRRSAEQYINLCTYAERLAKRHGGIAAESARVSGSLRTLTDVAADTYAADSGDILPLNLGMAAASKHYAAAQALLDDEARAWDEGALEDLKRQRDAMVSVREMFERRDRYDRDNIPFLERRIKTNEERLGAIRARPDGNVKPGEAEKLEDAILRVSFLDTADGEDMLTLGFRTRSPSSISTRAASSSRSASATRSCTSRAPSSRSRACIRTGPPSASSTPSCWPTTGGRWLMRWRACHSVSDGLRTCLES